MNLTNWLASPLAEALGWTLIHALWQGFAVVLTVAILLHLLRRSQAALRYRIGLGGLLMQFFASVGTFGWYYEPQSAALSVSAFHPEKTVARLAIAAVGESSWLTSTQGFLATHLTQIVWLWLIGVAVFGLRLIGGWAYVQRLRTTATLPVPPVLLETTARMALKLNVSVNLQITARATGPLVVGVLKPVILWPVGLLAGLSMTEVEAVLAHELAHVRRHDYLVNVLQSVVEVLYFFHPALWWLSARVREEREHCCDDLALTLIGDSRTLARALTLVEEWQHSQEQTPALAMAFAGKRQLLLQRVRRMLGIPTRPLVSNGSLAGLTLATMLLLSVSVYALQRADQPKPARRATSQNPPRANRRYKVDANSEYGMTNSGRISYVVWKGQKLPATRVAKLQQQLDLVMAGKLSLDAVKQPDRDILLTIIEKSAALDAGMKALSDGMAQIDYTNIEANANVNVNTDVKAELHNSVIEAIDSQLANEVVPAIAGDTSRLNSVKLKLEALTKEMQALIAERQPIADKLSKEMAELAAKMAPGRQQMGQYAKQQALLGKQQALLGKQQVELAQKLAPLTREIARLSGQNTARATQLLKQKERQSSQLEKQMDELGTKMGALGSQMGDLGQLTTTLEPYQQRMSMLADSIGKLYEPTSALAEQIGALSEQFAEQAEKQSAEAMEKAADMLDKLDTEGRPARAPRPPRMNAPRPPRPAMAPRAPRPPVDVIDAPPAPAVAPVPAPKPAPAAAPRPAAVPKIAPAPKPPRE